MAEAALAMRDEMSRDEEPSFKDHRYVKESTNTCCISSMADVWWGWG